MVEWGENHVRFFDEGVMLTPIDMRRNTTWSGICENVLCLD